MIGGVKDLVDGRRTILVRQTKEWGEILLGFESRNRFDLLDPESGEVVGHAAEQGKGFGTVLLRNLFGRCRQASIHVYDRDGGEIGRGEKPFRLYFHRMEAFAGGRKIGAIQRRFAWISRRFVIEDSAGNEVLQIESPWLRVWTFKLMFQGQEIGRISKEWGGFGRELFTDADTFGVDFGTAPLPSEVRQLLVIATFLIDFTCFENNSGSWTDAFGQ